jgi:hypothetical protein
MWSKAAGMMPGLFSLSRQLHAIALTKDSSVQGLLREAIINLFSTRCRPLYDAILFLKVLKQI